MKTKIKMTLIVLVLLALGSTCLVPSIADDDKDNDDNQRGLLKRINVLEAVVDDLTERVEELQGGACSCTTLNLQPLTDFPNDPSEGDLCVVWTEYSPGEYWNNLFCYLNGTWYGFLDWIPDPRQGN